MSSEDLLRQYVDTGLSIGKYQYDKLSPNLKKTYIRKRIIAIEMTDNQLYYWEFKELNDNQKNILKKYPRFFYLFPSDEQPELLNNYVNNLGGQFKESDLTVLFRELPVDETYTSIVDKVFDKFKEQIPARLMLKILLKYENHALDILKKNGEFTTLKNYGLNVDVVNLISKFLKLKNGDLNIIDCIDLGSNTSYPFFERYRLTLINILLKYYPKEDWRYRFKQLISSYSDNVKLKLIKKVNKDKLGPHTIFTMMSSINDDGILLEYVESVLKLDNAFETKREYVFNSALGALSKRISPLKLTDIFLKYHDKPYSDFLLNVISNFIPNHEKVKEKLIEFNKRFDNKPNGLNEDIQRIKDLLK